jgi:hypothetical protein
MAGIDFSKILADKETYKDDLTLRFKDADGSEREVPLGDFRSLTSREQKELSDRIADAQARETEASKRFESADNLGKQAAKVLADIEELKKNTRTAAPGEDPFNDPWLAPVKEALSKRDAEIADLKKLVASGQATLQQAAQIFLKNNWKSEYNSLNFGNTSKKPTRDELVKYAATNKLTDEDGIPSISRAWEEMSRADREEATKKEAYERGLEAGRIAAAANRVTQPGVPGSGGPAAPVKTNPGELPDLFTEGMKDPEIRGLLQQLAEAGIPMS